ncbi:aldehyde dehydrogenase family protein [Streptomyces sp. NPDC049687]|uniref:aldehyde dehydrogenase family protein n=1 Tax=Streptomyces sp. NPDC049687 TaxID=3365596 RepID=UPI0037B7FC10
MSRSRGSRRPPSRTSTSRWTRRPPFRSGRASRRPRAGRFWAKLVVGPPSDPASQVGPLHGAARDHVVELIEDARAKGAQVMAGGTAEGLFVHPTVLRGVTPGMRIYTDRAALDHHPVGSPPLPHLTMRRGRTAHVTRRAPRPWPVLPWLWGLAAAFSPAVGAAWLADARETEASQRLDRELEEFFRSV